jgi:MFS family permease
VIPPTAVAFALAGPLVLLGLVSGYYQVRGLNTLAARKHVPTDEYSYLRNRHRRRLLVAAILVLTGGLIAGAYLSGFEHRVDKIIEAKRAAEAAGKDIDDADKYVLQLWGGYWVVVISFVFVLLALAVVDAWATRRYWFKVLREMRDEHNTKLRRDLAVLRQHKDSRGGRFGRRAGEPTDPDDTPTPD